MGEAVPVRDFVFADFPWKGRLTVMPAPRPFVNPDMSRISPTNKKRRALNNIHFPNRQ
jgi:hypothetical protein